jgi:asparagine synthase (glutamine-hydrolysing)
MCGIAGYSGNFKSDILLHMSQKIVNRGPDDSGVWFDIENKIGLAHRRLSIIDLSPAGHQPMIDENNSAVIIFNGEIYNYLELRSKLESAGVCFSGKSDTEVLLKMYLTYGFDMLNMLNGIFAFAIWDIKTKNLFLARDHYGVKPLYYSEVNNGFLFASELKSILCDNHLDLALDYESIHNYMTYLWCPSPGTMLKNVKKMEPGHACIISKGRIEKKWCYYDITFSVNEITDFNEASRHTAELLEQAVKRQMIADVPVGAFLSGGLDSSSIVAFGRKYANNGLLKCFTIGFTDNAAAQEGFSTDLPFAKRVANFLDVPLSIIEIDSSKMASKLIQMIYTNDEPQADPAGINVLFISQLAREHGMKVLLSGAGGDDIFSGYRRHYALKMEYVWSWLPVVMRSFLKTGSGKFSTNSSVFRRIRKALSYADLREIERIAGYFHWIEPDWQTDLYSQNLKEKLKDISFSKPLLVSLNKLPSNTDPLNKMLYLECKHFLADHNLNYTDKMSMATGVETRVPFLDRDLVTWATSLPPHWKQHGREGKWILKKAMEQYLPYDVIYRSKSGFGVPLRKWLKNELSDILFDTLSKKSIESRGVFSFDAVQKLINADRNGMVDATYSIFSLICIELWCRLFVDKNGSGNIHQ